MKSLGAGGCGADVCIVVTVLLLAEIAALPCSCNVEGRRGANAGAVDVEVGAVVVDDEEPPPPPAPPPPPPPPPALPQAAGAVVCWACT